MDEYEEKLKETGLSLRRHQISGVETILSWRTERHGGIIADEMGLGKTCEAISAVWILTKAEKLRPHLIICPLSVVDHWEKELKRFGCGDLKYIKFVGDLKKRLDLCRRIRTTNDWNVLLTTYEYVLVEESPIAKFHWASLIFDEAQRIKNTNSMLHAAVQQLSVNWTILLTGTPIQNSMQELFALLSVIDKSEFPLEKLDGFIEKYSRTDNDRVVEELRLILSRYMIRRLKSEIDVDIPPSSQVILYHGLSPMQKDLYKAILSKNYRFLAAGTGCAQGGHQSGNRNSLLNIMSQLRKCALHPYLFDGMEPEPFKEGEHLATSSGKMMLLQRILGFLRKHKHRVLLFSQMTRMLDIVQDYFNYRRWSFERLDGRLKADMRFAAIDNFQRSNSEVFCFLLSTRAGGLGLTLTGADTVIFIDSDFNPQNDIQAAARCHRIGQTKHVKIIRLVTKNTVEEVIECYATRKLRMTNRIMESDGNVDKEKLTAVEISNMILHGLRYLNEEGKTNEKLLTETEFEEIIGRTDADGNWLDEEPKEKDPQEPNENIEPAVGEVSDEYKEAPNMYVFEGHDYKKDQEVLASIIEEARRTDSQPELSVESRREANRIHRVLRTKEELEEQNKRNLDRQRKAREERRVRMEEKKTKLWADNGYTSTALPSPEGGNEVLEVNENREDEERVNYYGPYFVHGDVTHPRRASHDHSKHAIIAHVVDDSGSFGHGGVFSALRAKSARIVDAYRLAYEMNDLHIGDAHLIENIDEREEHSSNEGSANDDEESRYSEQRDSEAPTWKRSESVVLIVAQNKHNRNEIREKPFVEGLKRLAAYAKAHDASSIHLARLGYGMTNVNWYSMEHMIRRHLTEKQIHTYIYYHDGRSEAAKREIRVGKKRETSESAEAISASKAEPSSRRQLESFVEKPTTSKSRDIDNDHDEKQSLQSEEEEEMELEDEEQEEENDIEFDKRSEMDDGGEEHYSSRKRRRLKQIFEKLVIWVHALRGHERQSYAALIDEYGGDAIEEAEGTDLVTHALFDESMAENGEDLERLKNSLPQGCIIVSKDWVDKSVIVGKAIDIASFIV
uniref:Chromodomain-helicase-DNA-binding protein 1-like protein n=1 Tax=Parascaris univalens TaxID=6257 RepID=A0A915BSU6_PARUN